MMSSVSLLACLLACCRPIPITRRQSPRGYDCGMVSIGLRYACGMVSRAGLYTVLFDSTEDFSSLQLGSYVRTYVHTHPNTIIMRRSIQLELESLTTTLL
jgi:hypothetical protein